MFADTDDAAAPETAREAAPVRSEQPEAPQAPAQPTALGAGVLRPKPAIPVAEPMNTASPVAQPSMEQPGYRVTEPSIGKGILLVVIVAVSAVVLGGGGWYLYQRFVVAPAAEEFPTPTTDTTDTNTETPVPEIETPAPSDTTDTSGDIGSEIIDDQVLFGEPIDSDGDGLDDIQEADIGTNPNNWDTDSDGLGDRDETVIWKTDPNNPDTDGDTYLDGTEVTSGYSPTGPGKLFTPPTTTNQ